jgi:hypothetical protein
MKYLFLSSAILLATSLSAQTCEIHGKIKNLEHPADTSFRVVFIKGQNRIDSTRTNSAGQFSKTLASGIYHIEILKNKQQSVYLSKVLLEEGRQDVNISLKFNKAKTRIKPPLPSGDSVHDISYFYIRGREEKTSLLTPALMRRSSDLDFASAYPSTYTAPAIDSMAKPKVQDATGQTMEMIAFGNWYMTFYPNPAAETLYIRLSEQVQTVTIKDLHGKVIFEAKNEGKESVEVDTSTWYNGVYIVSASNQQESVRGKLVVKH